MDFRVARGIGLEALRRVLDAPDRFFVQIAGQLSRGRRKPLRDRSWPPYASRQPARL